MNGNIQPRPKARNRGAGRTLGGQRSMGRQPVAPQRTVAAAPISRDRS
jgi:hypothetical protein